MKCSNGVIFNKNTINIICIIGTKYLKMNKKKSWVVTDHTWDGVTNLSGQQRYYSTMTSYTSLYKVYFI